MLLLSFILSGIQLSLTTGTTDTAETSATRASAPVVPVVYNENAFTAGVVVMSIAIGLPVLVFIINFLERAGFTQVCSDEQDNSLPFMTRMDAINDIHRIGRTYSITKKQPRQ